MEENTSPTHFIAPTVEALAPHFPAYDVEHFIAQGGMGAVYQANQVSLDRRVAIKILPREFGQDETFRASFEAEAKAMAKLNHPNLIGIYDFGEVDGMLFLIMEYVNGKSLFHSSHGQSIDPTQAAHIVSAICDGLEHAHAGGILHGDVKPANILLTPDAVPKIGDFGLARPMNESASADEVIYGTPGYTAPEIIARAQVDHRADIFSTGVMLHELLTGSLPDDSRTPPSAAASTPPSFDSIVARATDPNPDLRFTSADEMSKALHKASTSDALASPLKLSTSAPVTPPMSSVVLPPKKSKTGSVIGSILAVAVIVLIVAMVLPGNEEDTSKTPSEANTETPQQDTPPTPKPEPAPTPPPKPEPVIAIKPFPEPKVTEPKETVSEALARLRDKLASGERDEFPPQAVEHQGDRFLMLEKGMSQDNAQAFAEAHGAQLAVLAEKEAREELAKALNVSTPVWLAAGMASHDQWQWMDGTKWNAINTPPDTAETGRAIAMRANGEMISSKKSVSHRAILHWRKDATNPSTIEAQLERTEESIKSVGIEKAVYPVGTHSYRGSHYLLIKKTLSWEDAYRFAKSYDAVLASPASANEQKWIPWTYQGMNATVWLGGYLLNQNSPWRWINKEPFSANSWKQGEPSTSASNNRMLMELKKGQTTASWITSDGATGGASHYLLEWSKAAQSRPTASRFDLDKWLDGVNRKIADRVRPIIEDHKKEKDKEIASYIRDMKRAAKKMEIPGGGRRGRADRFNDYFERLVDDAMEQVEEDGEIPDDIPERAPRTFHDLTDKAQKSMDKLKEEHQKALTKELEFYTRGLLNKAASITKDGFTTQAGEIKGLVDEIGTSTDTFVSKIGL
ncbi:MAG: protein kinase [Akkermansiaceae bacterium]